MKNTDYDIQELLQREVYVNEKLVGTIVGCLLYTSDAADEE